jgi:uncharacterized LabA/DUF88 family protein
MPDRVAILLDGGFVKKKLGERLRRFPTVPDVVGLCQAVMRLQGTNLFRIYYYDSPPLEGKATNPISGSVLSFSTTAQAAQNRALIDSLEMQPDFAVRRGTLVQKGWKLGRAALKSLSETQRPIAASDLVPDLEQKGVDIRVGLDMAWISLKRIVEILVLVTGDSDFVPVMKFARREGLKVYLERLGHPVRPELQAHADIVL